jgi:hypothetical protein
MGREIGSIIRIAFVKMDMWASSSTKIYCEFRAFSDFGAGFR